MRLPLRRWPVPSVHRACGMSALQACARQHPVAPIRCATPRLWTLIGTCRSPASTSNRQRGSSHMPRRQLLGSWSYPPNQTAYSRPVPPGQPYGRGCRRATTTPELTDATFASKYGGGNGNVPELTVTLETRRPRQARQKWRPEGQRSG